VPASPSTVGVGEPDTGDWSTGDVGEPESDDGEVGVEAEPVQPVATNAATTRLTSDRELFTTVRTSCKFFSRLDRVS
jgi:hypothetical protein